jgi:essential nuclear protein 1
MAPKQQQKKGKSKKEEATAPGPKSKKQRRWQTEHAESESESENDDLIPAALTRKITAQAREQQEEEALAAAAGGGGPSSAIRDRGARRDGGAAVSDGSDEEEDEDAAELEGAGDYYEEVEELELDEDDARAMEMFMGGGMGSVRAMGGGGGTLNLGDVIAQKIAERAAASGGGGDGGASEAATSTELPAKVVEVYAQVGKLPKAFKIVPRLANWEEVLYATEPQSWSPAATREATRLFASNLNPAMAQRFFNLVLLPAVQVRSSTAPPDPRATRAPLPCRHVVSALAHPPCLSPVRAYLHAQDDIKEHGKLNFHLYLALKKALYKPSAFFKGLLLPLCEDRCTVREALIIGSVLQKVSVPMLHSAVAILKLAEMPFSPANALFMRTLLLKKYALPYRVVDSLVEYFAGFKDATDVPPVLWQQTLLAFAQHYKAEVTAEQKETIKQVLRAQPHPTITPEIRRELFSARARGEAYIAPIAGEAMEE